MQTELNNLVINKLKRWQLQCAVDEDFIAKYAEQILVQRLQESFALEGEQEGENKNGLLLYTLSPNLQLAVSSQPWQFDQIPFDARFESLSKLLQNQYNVILSNLAFDWRDASDFIAMLQLLLRSKGQFWFSAFGNRTMTSTQQIFEEIDAFPHFSAFYDMQDIGDTLLGSGFKNVVLDSIVIDLEYDSVERLIEDSRHVFGVNLHPDRATGLSPKRLRNEFIQSIQNIIKEEGKYVDQVEIIIAHGAKQKNKQLGVQIPVQTFDG